MNIKYLSENQVTATLRGGHAVEQWLGHTDGETYRTIEWLRIDVLAGGDYCVSVLDNFDDGNFEYLDIYSFEACDPDALSGVTNIFDELDTAVIFATTECGADSKKFVLEGGIQYIYSNFLAEYGLPPK